MQSSPERHLQMGPHAILRVRGGQPINGGPALEEGLKESFDDSQGPFLESTGKEEIIRAGQSRYPKGPNLVLGPIREFTTDLSSSRDEKKENMRMDPEHENRDSPRSNPQVKRYTESLCTGKNYETEDFPEKVESFSELPKTAEYFSRPESPEQVWRTAIPEPNPQAEHPTTPPVKPAFPDFDLPETIREEYVQAAPTQWKADPDSYRMLAVGLTKSYQMGKIEVPVLRGVNLGIHEGEFLSIIGQSGSGKSTLLHLLGTLDCPDEGTIYFDGQRIDNLSGGQKDILRNHFIGMIFQFYHLLPELSTLENVLSPLMIRDSVWKYLVNRRKYRQRGKEILESVGLSHRLHHRPNELSGGEMQRAAIARALISDPQILLADEPTGNLDAKSANEILELLYRLNKERNLTIVMVTHDLGIARKADRMISIYDGKIDHRSRL